MCMQSKGITLKENTYRLVTARINKLYSPVPHFRRSVGSYDTNIFESSPKSELLNHPLRQTRPALGRIKEPVAVGSGVQDHIITFSFFLTADIDLFSGVTDLAAACEEIK